MSAPTPPNPLGVTPDGPPSPGERPTGPDLGETTTPPGPPSLPAAPEGPFPRPFGRYLLRGVLGRGGMAVVYRAHDQVLDRDVALKIPYPEQLQDPVLRERFHREGRAAARLRHPNLCPVLDYGEWEGFRYLTMPLIEGRPLSRQDAATPLEAARLVRKLALAMAEAHRHHVVHRDLKFDNVLIASDGEPVIADFGLVLLLDVERLSEVGLILGTLGYAAPEQVEAQPERIGVACDVFALGVILYRLLTGRMPFAASNPLDLALQTLEAAPPPPSRLNPAVPPPLEAVCVKALARRVEDRFASMADLAGALQGCVDPPRPAGPRPLVPEESVRLAFVGMGERAPDWSGPQDQLWLDVGNDLRPGVIDHHHLTAGTGSAAGLLLAYPAFLDGAVTPARRPDDPFTLVLHDKPDLDSVASAHFALTYLATRAFPDGADALARYADEVDDGVRGATQDNPFSLYAAFQQLANRLVRRPANTMQEVWQELVREGVHLVRYALDRVTQGVALPEVDAFACPGLFGPADREEIANDLARYRRKLLDPATRATSVRLHLPGQFGGWVDVAALLARDVQNADDPERCAFFKDWARTDGERSPDGRGFAALCVYCPEGPRQPRRAILSVAPDSLASLRGLGALLDRAEAARRRQVFGVDDRTVEPATGVPKLPRPGYDNADPWYDGRAHRYTIVDSPRAGTLLTAEEIEGIFLAFGGAHSG